MDTFKKTNEAVPLPLDSRSDLGQHRMSPWGLGSTPQNGRESPCKCSSDSEPAACRVRSRRRPPGGFTDRTNEVNVSDRSAVSSLSLQAHKQSELWALRLHTYIHIHMRTHLCVHTRAHTQVPWVKKSGRIYSSICRATESRQSGIRGGTDMQTTRQKRESKQ